MFLSTGMGDSRGNLALQPAPDPASLHFRARAQLQEAAAMMWGEVGAPWLYLEKAAEVSELLLQNSGLQPAVRIQYACSAHAVHVQRTCSACAVHMQ